jgi:beta-xylosidase
MDDRLCGNPLFGGWYADPEIHLFGSRFYIYPTCSRAYEEQTCFEVWSSPDLADWRNEGTILDFADVPWSTNRAAWAPSAVEYEGRTYLYFSAGDGAGIGVAVADEPTGPFRDALGHALISEYHHGAQPIDAHAFKDDDGRNYLYYGGWREAVVVELGPDMISTQGDFYRITPENYVEGPFMVKRGGVYYFMWSEGSWGDETYSVAYGRSGSPFGPFEREGVVLKSDGKVGNSAGHHSVLQIPGTDEWYIAYHRRPVGEIERDHRVVCLDRMFFDVDGRIVPVVLTHEGVRRRTC